MGRHAYEIINLEKRWFILKYNLSCNFVTLILAWSIKGMYLHWPIHLKVMEMWG